MHVMFTGLNLTSIIMEGDLLLTEQAFPENFSISHQSVTESIYKV